MEIPANLQKSLGRPLLQLQKHSPTILTGVGLAAMTGGAFLAVKQTLKFDSVLSEAESRIEEARKTPEDTAALRKAYLRSVLEFTKLYGPAVSLFISGAISVGVGHGILHKRNVQMVAAYNALEKSFQAYRQRVIEDLGVEKDQDYRLGINETISKGDDGKKQSALEVDPSKASPYVRLFDETNDYWQSEPGYNQFFLNAEQQMINKLLEMRGHVFLNEVYDRLGFERTTAGALVGWVVKKNGGDNYIDFGVYDASTQQKRNFVNGYEKSIWLDFNVDGIIYDKI